MLALRKANVGPSTTFSGQEMNKSKRNWFTGIRFSGHARFYPYFRRMNQSWYLPNASAQGLTSPINLTADDGYQQPLMRLMMEGNPGKVSFAMEFQFNHFIQRTTSLTIDTTGHVGNLYVIFNMRGETDTRFGHMKLIAGGGVNWYRLSPFTLWQYQYRDDMFERYPWEPEGQDFGRYNSYYSTGDVPRDQRFGMQATQGFILEGTNMPLGIEKAVLLYGKTNTSGGFQSYLNSDPQNMLAGQLQKRLGDHKIGVNCFNQFGYTGGQVNYKPFVKDPGSTDTIFVEDNRISQTVITGDGRFEFDRFSIFTEAGMGSFFNSLYNKGVKDNAKPGVKNVSKYKREWNETLFLEFTGKKSLVGFPFKISTYRIGPKAVNNSSIVYNTSIEQAKPSTTVPDNFYINYYDGMLTDVGQLASNRQGINLFIFKDIRKLKIKFDLGMSQEVVNLAGDTRNGARSGFQGVDSKDTVARVPFTNSITFEHRLNGITRSRFAFYQRFAGPYNRLHSIFRRSFENLAITDDVINYKKSFTSADLELKYKLRFLHKELILSNYTNISSVQTTFSPIPVFTDKAFLRYFYEEFMAFYGLSPKLTLVGFCGIEKAMGNERTELADANGKLIVDANNKPIARADRKPLNQTGHGYGLGIDYNFHTRASLHLRNRWFNFSDKNFTQDKFRGNEATMEFKVFF
ncbi:MAG: hypothetical protein ACJ75J_08360 [Cytophagaceae bacterium]